MNCNAARQHWNLYHDSEGDAELHFQVSEHLAACPDCAQWFRQQSRVERLLAEKLRTQAPTPALWNEVLARCDLVRPLPARKRLWGVAVAVGAAALVIALVVSGFRFVVARSPDLAKLTAAKHQRLATGEERPQFQSQSDLEVERYLRRRVPFPVRCPPRKDAAFAVQGAGICQFADQPAAYLSGHVDGAAVSIFVLPRDGLSAFPHQHAALRQQVAHRCQEGPYAMVMGCIDKNAVVVIGQTAPQRLEKVLFAYGTYPDPH